MLRPFLALAAGLLQHAKPKKMVESDLGAELVVKVKVTLVKPFNLRPKCDRQGVMDTLFFCLVSVDAVVQIFRR